MCWRASVCHTVYGYRSCPATSEARHIFKREGPDFGGEFLAGERRRSVTAEKDEAAAVAQWLKQRDNSHAYEENEERGAAVHP